MVKTLIHNQQPGVLSGALVTTYKNHGAYCSLMTYLDGVSGVKIFDVRTLGVS